MKRTLLLALAALAMAAVSGCGFHSIPPGSVGVKFNGASGLTEHLLRPAVVWVGWNEQLIIYPTNVQQAVFVKSAAEGDRPVDDSIKASTSEGAVLPVDVAVSYRIPADTESIKTVFKKFGVPEEDPDHPLKTVQDGFVRWATIAAVNEVSGKHSIFDLLSKDRAQFGPDVKARMAPLLAQWGLRVEDVMIREIHPPEQIVQKINEQQQKYAEREQIKIQKQQAITDAQTTLIQAQQEAEKNRLLTQQGDQAVALKRLERRQIFIQRWDGRSPIVGSGPIPQF